MFSNPDDVTMDWSAAKRRGKIFLDHNMNARSKSIASVYSPRANADACVSMPLKWNEIGHMDPCDFTILTAPKRLRDVGDLWRGILSSKQDLENLVAKKR